MEMTKERDCRNQEKKISERLDLTAMMKTTVMGSMRSMAANAIKKKSQDETEISSIAKSERTLGELQRKIKRTVLAMLS